MAFFDKKQEVIDIKLTRFGKNLLSRGFFKPVYYRFFDDDILYNSELANISEKQNRSEERILESQRLKTQHLVVGVETSFDKEQNLINSGSAKTFMEINRRQDPLVADILLKYPLQNSSINSILAPQISLQISEAVINQTKSKGTVNVKGVDLPVPQLSITSSYTIISDETKKIPESSIPSKLMDSENYMDITGEKVPFLDKTEIRLDREDIYINLQELGIDPTLDNFEIEIYEITENDGKEELRILEKESEVKKYFDIKVDESVKKFSPPALDGRKNVRGRK